MAAFDKVARFEAGPASLFGTIRRQMYRLRRSCERGIEQLSEFGSSIDSTPPGISTKTSDQVYSMKMRLRHAASLVKYELEMFEVELRNHIYLLLLPSKGVDQDLKELIKAISAYRPQRGTALDFATLIGARRYQYKSKQYQYTSDEPDQTLDTVIADDIDGLTEAITDSMSKDIAEESHDMIESRQRTPLLKVRFDIDHAMMRCMEECKDFGAVVSVTGQPSRCLAMSCEKYAAWHWGECGTFLLNCMERFFHKSDTKKLVVMDLHEMSKSSLPGVTTELICALATPFVGLKWLHMWRTRQVNRTTNLCFAGSLDSDEQGRICSIILQFLTWFCAVFDTPPMWTQFGRCTRYYREPIESKDSRLEPEDILVRISAGFSHNVRLSSLDKTCWRSLLPQASVASSSIPDRTFGEGLELSFDLMLQLLGTSKAWFNGSTICIRSNWAMLVLVDLQKDTSGNDLPALQWHLYPDDDGSDDHGSDADSDDNSSDDDDTDVTSLGTTSDGKGEGTPSETVQESATPVEELAARLEIRSDDRTREESLDNPTELARKLGDIADLSWLPQCRHFLGYCSEAKVVLGTSDAAYNLRYTSLPLANGVTAKLRSITVGAGYQGFFNIEGEVNVTPHRSVLSAYQPGTYDQMILRARNRVVLVYDMLTQRACLVPFVCLLLHMAVLSARRDILQFPDIDISTTNAMHAAARFLTNHRRHVLVPTEDTLETLVTRLFITATACMEQRRIERDIRRPWRTGVLYGWELMDVISDRDEIFRKEVLFRNEHATLFSRSAHPRWLRLCSHIGVFVCSGLGEAIQPADMNAICNTWRTRLAQERFSLLASTACLKILAESKGCQDPPLQLAQKAYWRPIGEQAVLFTPCAHAATTCVKHIQQIRRSKRPVDNPVPLPEDGAIVFGKE